MPINVKFKNRLVTAISITAIAACTSAAQADERSSTIGNSRVPLNLTPEQAKQTDDLLSAARQRATSYGLEIEDTRRQISKLFLQPSPDQKAILEIQSKQDAIKARRDEDLLQANLKVRQLLNPEQRQWLGIIRASEVMVGVELSPTQLKKYRELMQPYSQATLATQKKRADLELDRAILLQEMDLVHGCHVMNLDEAALIANQRQINALSTDLSNKRIQIEIALHNMLSDKQKKQLLGTAQIFIPDRRATEKKNELTTVFAPPEQVFKGAKLSQEQKDKYNCQMTKFVAELDRSKKLRENLASEQKKLLSSLTLDEAALLRNQERINQSDEQHALTKISQIVKTRDILTKEQRHAVFNRHHPKIWYDTGINSEQDKKIMVIHMKIEDSDREGRRKMSALTIDMQRLFFEPSTNDQEILSAQRTFDRIEAETTRKQLDCLFEGRSVLTDAQRVKLVQLMGDTKQ